METSGDRSGGAHEPERVCMRCVSGVGMVEMAQTLAKVGDWPTVWVAGLRRRVRHVRGRGRVTATRQTGLALWVAAWRSADWPGLRGGSGAWERGGGLEVCDGEAGFWQGDGV